MALRMTLQTLAVLRVLLDDPLGEHYGLEIAKAAGLPGGSLYPILASLEHARLVSSAWEELDEHTAGRRRRRYYRLTPEGAAQAEEALADTVRRLSPKRAQARPLGPSSLPGWAGAK